MLLRSQGTFAAAGLLLCLAGCSPRVGAGAAPQEPGLFAYLRQDRSGKDVRTHLMRVSLDGTEIGDPVGLARAPEAMRPGSAGDILAWDPAGAFLLDREGKTAWSLDGSGCGIAPVASADLLPGGSIFLCGTDAARPGGRRVAIWTDPSGRRAREVELPPSAVARPIGEDRILVISERRILELDWSGRLLASCVIGTEMLGYDAVKLDDGRYLVAGFSRATRSPDRGGASTEWSGRCVAKLDADGRVIWRMDRQGAHTLQPLPGGGALVGPC